MEELVILLLMRWSKKAAPRDAFSGEYVLKYGPVMKGFGLLFTGTMLVLTVGLVLSDEKFGPGLVVMMFALDFLGLITVLEAFGVSIRLGDGSISGHAPWRMPKVIAWADVTHVRYSESMKWFVITGAGGTKVRVSALISGLGSFATEVRSRLTPAVYERAEPTFATLGV